MLRGNVLITGGAGFLGRAIMARARRESWPAHFTIYSRDERKQDLCKHMHPGASYVLGDIRDIDRLNLIMQYQDIVVHAAALKYIPEAEQNVGEAVGVNIDGTRSVIVAARNSSVKNLVFISTDKAAEPANTYGATKMLGEKLMYEASRLISAYGGPVFNSVRYGNVVGSTGSVVPLFKRMAAETGEVTLTDPSMTRFWITADEAIDLIIETAGCPPGSILIPKPKALSLLELAEIVVPDAGKKVIGPRPGEKHHEKLMTHGESMYSRDLFLGGVWRYVLHPEHEVHSVPTFELTSDQADKMPAEEFLRAVEEAENI